MSYRGLHDRAHKPPTGVPLLGYEGRYCLDAQRACGVRQPDHLRGWLIAAKADVHECCHGLVAASCRSSSGRSAGGWTSRSAGMTSSPMSLIERINLSCSIPPNIIQLLMWVAPTLAARLNLAMTVAGLPKKSRSR